MAGLCRAKKSQTDAPTNKAGTNLPQAGNAKESIKQPEDPLPKASASEGASGGEPTATSNAPQKNGVPQLEPSLPPPAENVKRLPSAESARNIAGGDSEGWRPCQKEKHWGKPAPKPLPASKISRRQRERKKEQAFTLQPNESESVKRAPRAIPVEETPGSGTSSLGPLLKGMAAGKQAAAGNAHSVASTNLAAKPVSGVGLRPGGSQTAKPRAVGISVSGEVGGQNSALAPVRTAGAPATGNGVPRTALGQILLANVRAAMPSNQQPDTAKPQPSGPYPGALSVQSSLHGHHSARLLLPSSPGTPNRKSSTSRSNLIPQGGWVARTRGRQQYDTSNAVHKPPRDWLGRGWGGVPNRLLTYRMSHLEELCLPI